MVSFHPLDISDEDSFTYVLYTADSAVQYGEDADVRTSRDLSLGEGELGTGDYRNDFGALDLVDGRMEQVD